MPYMIQPYLHWIGHSDGQPELNWSFPVTITLNNRQHYLHCILVQVDRWKTSAKIKAFTDQVLSLHWPSGKKDMESLDVFVWRVVQSKTKCAEILMKAWYLRKEHKKGEDGDRKRKTACWYICSGLSSWRELKERVRDGVQEEQGTRERGTYKSLQGI